MTEICRDHRSAFVHSELRSGRLLSGWHVCEKRRRRAPAGLPKKSSACSWPCSWLLDAGRRREKARPGAAGCAAGCATSRAATTSERSSHDKNCRQEPEAEKANGPARIRVLRQNYEKTSKKNAFLLNFARRASHRSRGLGEWTEFPEHWFSNQLSTLLGNELAVQLELHRSAYTPWCSLLCSQPIDSHAVNCPAGCAPNASILPLLISSSATCGEPARRSKASPKAPPLSTS